MKKYTDSQLQDNYNKFLSALEKSFGHNAERLDNLNHMYSMGEMGESLILAPASGNREYHNAYEGGYIDHVMNVARNSLRLKKIYSDGGGTIDFTDEELLFAAFHHDLGKLGIKGQPYYLPNDSQWHIDNRGEIYKYNEKLPFMTVTDRAFFLLNEYGIQYNQNEWFGLKLADGMYEEGNETYLRNYIPRKFLKQNIQYIVHWADHMSTAIERDNR